MKKKKSLPLLLADDSAIEVDHEKRSGAVKLYASKLAQTLGCSIDLVHVDNLSLYPVRTSHYKPFIDRYFEEKRETLASAASSFKVPTRPIVLSGDPAKKLLSLGAKRNAYEMMVLGTSGRTGLTRIVLGSVAEEVLRQSRIPVLTIGPKAQERVSETFLGSKITILVPTSLTANSVRAEKYALALAGRLGGKVVFFHSLREALHPILTTAFSAPSSSVELREFFEEIKASAIKSLASKVRGASKNGVSANYILDDKTPSSSESILKEATRSEASFIVMGTHGRSMASGAFFGRTARDVILSAPVPVLTVHSKRS